MEKEINYIYIYSLYLLYICTFVWCLYIYKINEYIKISQLKLNYHMLNFMYFITQITDSEIKMCIFNTFKFKINISIYYHKKKNVGVV